MQSIEEAQQRAARLTSLLKLAGYDLVKWLSSDREVLQAIPSEARVDSSLDLTKDKLPTVGTLGMIWNSELDVIQFKIDNQRPTKTKRDILREFSSLYDPHGFCAVVTVFARMLMQETWRSKLHWDEPLPESLQRSWAKWYGQLHALERLQVTRCLIPNAVQETSFHVFCDASEKAYGAVVYCRNAYSSGEVDVRFVLAKARVAPVKPTTITKLELQAAVVGSRLASAVVKELSVPIDSFTFWSDSKTALDWIKAENARYKIFVANRVTEILDVADSDQWRHVPGRENPADELSRGVLPADLKTEDRWFTGPGFLKHRPEEWPKKLEVKRPTEELAEEHPVLVSVESEPCLIRRVLNRSSSWTGAVRVIAFMLRFVNRTLKRSKPVTPWLSVKEIRAAELLCIRMAQQDCFPEDVKALKLKKPIPRTSRLRFVTPYLDEEGILRVRGRIEKCQVAIDVRHPKIIPYDHPIARLLVNHVHELIKHDSVDRTLNEVLQRYWILKGRATVKKWVSRCPECRRKKAQPLSQIMAPLPAHRVALYSPPFKYVGIDYFGPITVSMF